MTYDDWKTRTPEDEHAMLCGIDHTRPLADDDDDPDDPCDDRDFQKPATCNCYVAGLPPSAAARNPPHAFYCPQRETR